ncbi:hypothetical protein C8Q79DRAFT_229323 [Trametes meyenii]|nr:hypothetical protein C8Q79DRAFT_229323 [Trametes meyenii]
MGDPRERPRGRGCHERTRRRKEAADCSDAAADWVHNPRTIKYSLLPAFPAPRSALLSPPPPPFERMRMLYNAPEHGLDNGPEMCTSFLDDLYNEHVLVSPHDSDAYLSSYLDDIPSFLRCPSVPPLSPSITDSDDWTSVRSPISDAVYVDDFLPFLGNPLGEQVVDELLQFGLDPCVTDPVKEFTFAYEHDAHPYIEHDAALELCGPGSDVEDSGPGYPAVTVNSLAAHPLTDGTLSPIPNPPPSQPTLKRGRNDESVEIKKPTKGPVKRRRRQDTTPCHKCGECGILFARKHNLTMHIDAKHLGKRPFLCEEGMCGQAFGRKHDLERHHQSMHTDLGSPRRKPTQQ